MQILRNVTVLFALVSFGLISSSALSLATQETTGSPQNGDQDYVVYSVSQALNLTNNPKDASPKDYYINMGKQQGVKAGSILEVRRRISTYDLLTEQLYRDLTIPIAKVKVIHVEPLASVARLQKLAPVASNPVFSPRAVMVGDFVRFSN